MVILALLAMTARVGAQMETGLDYFSDAGGAIDSLARGDFKAFFATQPLMGSFSLVLRAPFVAAVFHSSESTVYLAGAVPCILATLALGMALGRVAADRGASPGVQGLVTGLCVINPLTLRALHWGHPEELLAGALCVGAVLAALRDRELFAAVLLGLALATKQWALLAIPPVLFAAGGRRVALTAVAGTIAAAFTLPFLVADGSQFASTAETAAGQGSAATMTTPWNVWWPLSTLTAIPGTGLRYFAPEWVARVAHPGIVAAAIPLSLLLWRRAGRRRDDALLLLALLFLVRCVFDNWNNDYYHVPLVLSLIAWETVRHAGRPPYLSLAVILAAGLSFWPDQTQIFAGSVEHAALLNALYLAWALPLGIYLARTLYAPGGAPVAVRASERWSSGARFSSSP
jgi:hypothetical protein